MTPGEAVSAAAVFVMMFCTLAMAAQRSLAQAELSRERQALVSACYDGAKFGLVIEGHRTFFTCKYASPGQ